jgi:hypothetical protein
MANCSEKHPALSPSPRAWHEIAYTRASKSILLFGGGVDRGSFTDETWVYKTENNNWTQVPK